MISSLKDKYPAIFKDEMSVISQLAMDGSMGWDDILDRLCRDLQELAQEEGIDPPTAKRIKEKFGTLRFYVNGITASMRDRLSEAEDESTKTCEICGNPGSLCQKATGRLKTLCDAHKAQTELWQANAESHLGFK